MNRQTSSLEKNISRFLRLGILFGTLACTGRSPENQKVPEKNPSGPSPGSRGGATPPASFETQSASATITITESDLKKAAPKDNLNLTNLQYKVTYQDVVVASGAMTFKDGKADISLIGLPANQPAELKLEIFQADKPKLTAEVSSVTLPPAKVTPVEVTLTPVDSASAGGGGAGSQTNTGTSTATSSANTGTSTASSPVSGGNAVPNGASSTWDGKSDRGTKQWKIVPQK
jgi:hypothetical protein